MSSAELLGVTGDSFAVAVAGNEDPPVFQVPDMPTACMLHMMLRLEESRNTEQRKAGGIKNDILDNLLLYLA
jgi:hypothetical protein